MNTVGFLAKHAKKAGKKRQEHVDNADVLYCFDSGNYMTFKDATHHIVLFGTTGSGKTESFVFEMLNNCIMKQFGGFGVDSKNNMSEKVRAICAHHARLEDFIEIGSEETAISFNLLEGLRRNEIGDLFSLLLTPIVSTQDPSKSWHEKGRLVAVDVAEVLQYLSRLDRVFAPTISNVAQIMNNSDDVAPRIFQLFEENKKFFVDEHDSESLTNIEALISSIKGNRFHVFTVDPKVRTSANYAEQTTWAFQCIRGAFAEFLSTPGFARNFCCATQESFCMEKALEQGKVVFLRLNPTSGPMGACISRYLTNLNYAATYKLGLKRPDGKYTFVVLDEFQQYADLSDARFSDASFVAQAREFGCIFICATQSMSALLSKKHDEHCVNQFVSNCNCRILLYSDDPLLMRMASIYDKDIELNKLGKKAFFIQYDSREREHKNSVETMQEAYEHMQALLKDVKESTDIQSSIKAHATLPLHKYAEHIELCLRKVKRSAQKRVIDKRLEEIIGN